MKAKKSLGQHFLADKDVIDRMIDCASLQSDDVVIEIGPGTGVLTQRIAEKATKVIAVETDHDLIPSLLKQFPITSNVSIVEKDILSADILDIVNRYGGFEMRQVGGAIALDLNAIREEREKRSKAYGLGTVSSIGALDKEARQIRRNQYKVVANIPYYITADIVRYFLELATQPATLTLMVQKEVAERMTAPNGQLSILGVAVQYYARARYEFTASSEAFDPAPKVESAVITLTPYRQYDKERDEKLFRLVRAGFSARRKTLANTISASMHVSKDEVETMIASLGLRNDIRAQALSVDDWIALASAWERNLRV